MVHLFQVSRVPKTLVAEFAEAEPHKAE